MSVILRPLDATQDKLRRRISVQAETLRLR